MTFAKEFLPREADCPDFINADLIAAGISPFDPDRAAIRAGRLMLLEIKRRIVKSESFAFETTLSGRYYASLIPDWRGAGYHVKWETIHENKIKGVQGSRHTIIRKSPSARSPPSS